MDCFPDYCLACDRQIVEGLYCSQACRLTDLERGGSTATSPTAQEPMMHTSTNSSITSPGNHRGFFLPQAIDFSALTANGQTRSVSTSSIRPVSDVSTLLPSPQFQTVSCPASPHRVLTPSSSRSSLISGCSSAQAQSSDTLSEEAKSELRDYFHAFEHTRERRRQSHPYIRPDGTHYARSARKQSHP